MAFSCPIPRRSPTIACGSFSTSERPLHSKISNNAATLRIATGLFIAILCGGCQSVHVHESVIAKFPGSDTDSQLNFWHELAGRHLTSNDDAFHGLLLYLDSKDD